MGLSDLQNAIEKAEIDRASECLLSSDFDLNESYRSNYYFSYQTPLNRAIRLVSIGTGDRDLREEVVLMLLQDPRIEVDFEDEYDSNALNAAAERFDISGRIMKAIIEAGQRKGLNISKLLSTPSRKYLNGEYITVMPLYLAAYVGNLEAVRELLKAGAQVDGSLYDLDDSDTNETALFGVLSARVNLIDRRDKLDRGDEQVILEIEKKISNCFEIARTLIHNHANVNRTCNGSIFESKTVLEVAVLFKDVDIIKELLSAGADPLPAKICCDQCLKKLQKQQEDIGEHPKTTQMINKYESILEILNQPVLTSSHDDDEEQSSNFTPR